jgi:hypothetical protein
MAGGLLLFDQKFSNLDGLIQGIARGTADTFVEAANLSDCRRCSPGAEGGVVGLVNRPLVALHNRHPVRLVRAPFLDPFTD